MIPARRLCLALAALLLCLLASAATAAASEPTYTSAPGTPLSPSMSSGGSGLAVSPSGGLLAEGTAMYAVAASGALTPVGGTPPDPSARAVAFSPSGTLLAAANEGVKTISLFSVGSSGALTAAPGSPLTLGAQPASVVFNPSGSLLEVSAGESLYIFSVGASGALTPAAGSPHSVKGTGRAAFSPTGGLLAVPDSAGVSMFSVSAAGALTTVSGSPFAASGAPGGLAAFASSGNALTVSSLACAGCTVSTGVTTFSVASSGALTSTGSGTFSASQAFAFSPTGNTAVTTPYDAAGVNLQSVSTSGVLGSAQALKTPEPVANIAFSAGGVIVAEGISRAVTVLVPSSTSSGTSWVGALGSEGYDLAGWNGESDASNLPDATVSLVKGSRVVWAANTSDARALTSQTGSTRTAAGYYDPSELQVKLTFPAAYSGNLRLYAVDWAGAGAKEAESISVGGSSVGFANNVDMGSRGFSEGQWAIFAVNEPAGGSLTITVTGEGGAGAMLSGIFLGDAGSPPGAPPAVTNAPQGSWVGTYGHNGYDLAGWDGSSDVANMPGVSLGLTQGSRYVWAPATSDVRALESPNGSTRDAATYYSPSAIKLGLTFAHAYTGNLHLYALDWDHQGRRETISVGGQTAVLGSDFSQGAWVTFSISVAAGETVPIVVTRTAGPNAVLSGVFLGDAGAPPALETPSAPQGSWVGAYGSAGYDLDAWNGSGDLASMPGATVGLAQGSRYVWTSSTSDARALESPDKLTREAATYYSATQLRVTLTFSAAYTGNLHLYALDWDHQGRRETISVGGQTAVLGSDFSQGAWVTFPVSVAAGATVSIVVDRTAGPNAVLSGIFLGDAPPSPGPAVAGAQGTLIPLYDNANPADWSEACSQTNGSGGGSLLIADVAEGAGPGSASVPAWANVIDGCYSYDRASVIGYVWTDYGEGGTASIAGIESEINAWYAYYPGAIAGIFFDGVSDDVPGTTTSNESFYRTLAAYVHTHEGSGNEVVFNFGANPGSEWMFNSAAANNANVIVTFEGSYDTSGENPYTAWTQAPWEASYPAHDFAALIYNAPDEAATPQPASACSALAKQNIGYTYVGTWYDQLPPYFGSFLTDSFSGGC